MSKNSNKDLESSEEKERGNQLAQSPKDKESSRLQSTKLQSHLEEIEESQSEMNAVGYEDLSTFSRYNIGESGTEERAEIYERYAKALQRRVRAKLERKSAIASIKALQEEKGKLSFELETLKSQAKEKEQGEMNSLKQSIEHLKQQISFQAELKTTLQSQLQTQSELTLLSSRVVNSYPRDKMASYLSLMQSQSDSIKTSGLKISAQLQLQQIFLQNLQDIISELPQKGSF